MFLYFWLIHIAAFFGHAKARKMVEGQKAVKAFVQDTRLEGDVIWFHASSVGEFEQARPVIERLTADGKSRKVIVTFFSPSGFEARKNYPLTEKVLYLPFATRRNAQLFLDAVRPQKAIFVKYDFWPAYLRELRKRKIPTYLICGIFMPKQLFFRPWGAWYRHLLGCFTHLFVQDNASQELLAQHGISNVSVAGDTRFDRVYAIAQQEKHVEIIERFISPEKLSPFIPPRGAVIVAGSTWPKDEELLARYIDEREDLRLILAPHEIDEAHLHTIFQYFKGRYVRFSEANYLNISHVRVLIIDQIGLLSTLYRYGQVAYVGGGFGVGIHNTLEPAVYGIPVIFGPNYERFREAKCLIAAGAAQSVKRYEDFAAAMDNALANHEKMGQSATEYVQSELGATNKICQQIFDLKI